MMCNCVAKVNKQLAKSNTSLVQISLLNFKTGRASQSITIATQKLERKRGKPKIMLPTYCPFCGTAIRKTKPLTTTEGR